MTLSAEDLALGRAARYLVACEKPKLATLLLTCEITDYMSGDNSLIITIVGPRDAYELLWEVRKVQAQRGEDTDVNWLWTALVRTAPSAISMYGFDLTVEYGAAHRDAATQTELYMYVFGDDPVGNQVQVLDVGPHSAPTRQLIVSPVPVLPVTDLARDDKLCFVAMPFAPQFRLVYNDAIAPAIAASGLTSRRADDISQPGAILTQIWNSLLQARLVIADLSGGNGNVLYELGLAHVLGHEAILLTQDINNVPFDLRHQRTIVYGMQGDGLDALRSSLTTAIQSSLAVKR